MASAPVVQAEGIRTGALLLASAASNGSPSHPYFASKDLLEGADSARNLADAVHMLCALHGRQPGIADLAIAREADAQNRRWLIAAADGFQAERLYLARLAVAAGPIPGTPGSAGSEAALLQQYAALGTLAKSERRGCALGAASALMIDWRVIRQVLDRAAERLDIAPPPFACPLPADIAVVADRCGAARATERALLFGAEQMLIQHRGLWDLLEARQQARAAL